MEKAFIDQHFQAVKELATVAAKATDWAAEHPDEARKLVVQILEKRGDEPGAAAAAAYWPG
jgi:ABC-type nitrate/sulfonate/bicarbonate transport system substrate-binding protein